MLNEAHIIAYLKHEFPEKIGDDAAVFPFSKTQSYLITKDILLEDVHFNLTYFDAMSLAHKALHVNLSDIAAMGAEPQFVLLGLGIPSSYRHQLPQFLQQFTASCQRASVMLIGGDTTRSSDKLMISITVIGIAENTHIKYRCHASPNDLIYLAGNLGFAHLGLQALEHKCPGFETFKQACLTPMARLKEGAWLARKSAVHAMMDVSDGLFIDLTRLCEASLVACEINLDYLEPSCEFEANCQTLNLDPFTTQLTGGEDYGLLVTLESAEAARITTTFKKTFGYPLTPIGLIKKGDGVSFIQHDKPQLLTLKPFSHFGEYS